MRTNKSRHPFFNSKGGPDGNRDIEAGKKGGGNVLLHAQSGVVRIRNRVSTRLQFRRLTSSRYILHNVVGKSGTAYCPRCQKYTKHTTPFFGFPFHCAEPHGNDGSHCLFCGEPIGESKFYAVLATRSAGKLGAAKRGAEKNSQLKTVCSTCIEVMEKNLFRFTQKAVRSPN